ncbi:HIT domain-containing protein [Akkermansiaceae bacterium]|nr:HIT domain-containing protein [Akkermansiaceae bacterium]
MSEELTIFEKIINHTMPATVVYEDDQCICIKDIEPQAPVHLLLIPKKKITRIGEAVLEDKELLGYLMLKIQDIANQEGFAENGFRVVINNGRDAGELVPHLHLHLLAGKKL